LPQPQKSHTRPGTDRKEFETSVGRLPGLTC
jgi:hypothetical protein